MLRLAGRSILISMLLSSSMQGQVGIIAQVRIAIKPAFENENLRRFLILYRDTQYAVTNMISELDSGALETGSSTSVVFRAVINICSSGGCAEQRHWPCNYRY